MRILPVILVAAAVNCAANENASILEHPILNAARTGTAQEVVAALEPDPGSRDIRTNVGSTPLHLAAANAAPGALKALIAAGADPNARDHDGMTPLHVAAYSQNAAHAQLLLEAGADPHALTATGRDPTSVARKAMAYEVAGVISLWLLKKCSPGKPC
ncbi:ankyrin repeat domain-containing protein [Dechloromonas sp. CZR5]|uniref:ankyrin repeat domain-containing protein n=1 Tax=Dechloromonas sp. CZR5 TaxID=2608630 RepID=UPI00123E04E6|nr:ankyrin repeat domain-containing protein [Dechloromonas sp. CZR5]